VIVAASAAPASAGATPIHASSATPSAIMPKPQPNTARRLASPAGIGRSGRCFASHGASKASLRNMPPV